MIKATGTEFNIWKDKNADTFEECYDLTETEFEQYLILLRHWMEIQEEFGMEEESEEEIREDWETNFSYEQKAKLHHLLVNVNEETIKKHDELKRIVVEDLPPYRWFDYDLMDSAHHFDPKKPDMSLLEVEEFKSNLKKQILRAFMGNMWTWKYVGQNTKEYLGHFDYQDFWKDALNVIPYKEAESWLQQLYLDLPEDEDVAGSAMKWRVKTCLTTLETALKDKEHHHNEAPKKKAKVGKE